MKIFRPDLRSHSFAAAIVLLCMAAASTVSQARAQEYFDPFTVKEVPVDVTADTAANARNIAIGEAQSRALDMLLRRMTLKEDRARLPRLGGNSVSRLVQSIEFAEERYSSTRYIGKLNITFSGGGIRALLGRSNIPFAEAPAHPVIVLPVLNQGAPRMQSDSNPWWVAWNRLNWNENLLALTVPKAQDLDARGPGAAEVAQGDGPWLEAIGRRYNTTQVLVPVATLENQGGAARLRVSTRHYGLAGERTEDVEFAQQTGETVDAMLMRAAREIGEDVTSAWKRNAMVGQGPQTKITAVLDMSSLQQFVTVRERLRKAPIVKNPAVQAMSTNRAVFDMSVTVPPQQLASAMVQYGLDMSERNGDWYVAPRR